MNAMNNQGLVDKLRTRATQGVGYYGDNELMLRASIVINELTLEIQMLRQVQKNSQIKDAYR